jgi:hypothetical protein
MATLAEIRAKLQAQETKSSGGDRPVGDNAIYPFWNLEQGKESTVRFLPDGNSDNTFFWAERLMIKLPFAGIKGETDSNQYKYKYHVWKCMAKHVQSSAKFAVGLKTRA